MHTVFKVVFFMAMILINPVLGFSQIKIEDKKTEDSHLVWSTHGFQNEEGDDIYQNNNIKVEKDDNRSLHLGNATKLWQDNDHVYYLKFTRPMNKRSNKSNFNNTIFYLSDTKDGAVLAIKDLINAIKTVTQDQALAIKDFKGNSFELRFRSAGKRYILYNSTIGVTYVGRVKPLQDMVDNAKDWR